MFASCHVTHFSYIGDPELDYVKIEYVPWTVQPVGLFILPGI
jgi:hypothetical protein